MNSIHRPVAIIMIDLPPYLFSLLDIALLTSLTAFILIRRPRKLLTWAFAAEMTGLAIFFIAEIAQKQPAITPYGITVWKFVLTMGSHLAIYAALALVYLLRDKHLEKWEVFIVLIIIGRMIVDAVWAAGFYLLQPPRVCLSIVAFDHLRCLYDEPRAIATALIAEVLLGLLFLSTAFKATEPKRSILRRYLLWIVLMMVAGSVFWQSLELTNSTKPDILPVAPILLISFLPGLRLFLALEEKETGISIPITTWPIMLWVVLLLAAVILDLIWGVPNAPVWTLLALAGGLTAGAAVLFNSAESHAAIASSDFVSSPAATSETSLPPQLLQIYLFGPMRVVRNGEALSNTSEVWRSAKTRSLLAYLALKGNDGVTQIELVDALWPHNGDITGADDQRHRKNLNSYLSTLRKVLEPDGDRGSETFVERDSERIYLRHAAGIEVDIWEFEQLGTAAYAHRRAGDEEAMLAALNALVKLYHFDGLLPDELYLPIEFIESRREYYRQQWMRARQILDCLNPKIPG
ncbi:MAG: hypothetical protein WAZ19_16865 [Anaerolineae bacterium]